MTTDNVYENSSSDHPSVDDDHTRPQGVADATIEAVGAISNALETLERARGHLYEFHQLMGTTDLELGDAADKLRGAGHGSLADEAERELVGRNVIAGRWTFQIVEEFDDNYWSVIRQYEHRLRVALQDGKRHVFEAEMKEQRRTHGKPEHRAHP